MTKNEIAFLLENGYTVADIMTMTTPEEPSEPVEEPLEPVEEPSEPVEESSEPASDQPDAIKELNRSIADLHKEIEKLAGRIAAQGIRSAGADAPRESIDDALSGIAKKLNGGK